jgi:hypothetical protein
MTWRGSLSNGAPDPVDQAQQNVGQPSPLTNNSLAPSPSTTPIQIASPRAPAAPTLSYGPTAEFRAFATSILEQKMGATNFR